MSDLKNEKMIQYKNANLHRLNFTEGARRRLEIDTSFIQASNEIKRDMARIADRVQDINRRLSEKMPTGSNPDLSAGSSVKVETLDVLRDIKQLLIEQNGLIRAAISKAN